MHGGRQGVEGGGVFGFVARWRRVAGFERHCLVVGFFGGVQQQQLHRHVFVKIAADKNFGSRAVVVKQNLRLDVAFGGGWRPFCRCLSRCGNGL